MMIKALVSFGGAGISMMPGEERNLNDTGLLADLLDAGYVKSIQAEPEEDQQKDQQEDQQETGNEEETLHETIRADNRPRKSTRKSR